MNHVQNIEKQLDRFTKHIFADRFGRKKLTFFGSMFMPFNGGFDKYKLVKPRSYYLIDFNDFIDYATSEIPAGYDIYSLPEKEIHFFESLPIESPITFDTEEDKISIMGCALARYKNWMSIAIQFRSLNLHKLAIDDEKEVPFSIILLNIFENGEDRKIYENIRIEALPPNITGETYFLSFKFYDYDGVISAFSDDSLPEEVRNLRHTVFEAQSDKVEKHSDLEFELARLMLYLPNYVDFMYDLLVEERKKIGVRKKTTSKLRKRDKQSGKPIYKIIKSIRVVHDQELNMERESGSTIRTWTPPNYRFRVRGHWRQLQHPWSKGHAPDGAEILGRTWVSEFEKGKDNEPLITEVVERSPQIVIKVKQTLSYARDVLKSNKKSKDLDRIDPAYTSVSAIDSLEKPTEEWMYEERKKLTASLRYIILKRDHFQCVLCGAKGSEGARLEVDHIIPLLKWGKTEETNLRTLCKDCNIGKGIKIE